MSIFVGYQGEENAREIDFSAAIEVWEEKFGTGTVSLLYKRNGDTAAYPVALSDGVWTVDETDTEKAGVGSAQLMYTAGGIVVASKVMQTVVSSSLIPTQSGVPAAGEGWVSRLADTLAGYHTKIEVNALLNCGDDAVNAMIQEVLG